MQAHHKSILGSATSSSSTTLSAKRQRLPLPLPIPEGRATKNSAFGRNTPTWSVRQLTNKTKGLSIEESQKSAMTGPTDTGGEKSKGTEKETEAPPRPPKSIITESQYSNMAQGASGA